jgi:hypothetical protein
MILVIWNVHISSVASFLFIIMVLGLSIGLSVLYPKKRTLPFVGEELPF